MPLLVPTLEVTSDRIRGCTPWLARALMLFSSSRCVAVNRHLRHVIVETRSFWFWRHSQVVSFNRIARIVFRAQRMPGFRVSLSGSEDDGGESAAFFIGLALKGPPDELPLFTVWQRQPRPHDLLDKLAGVPDESGRLGDEHAVRIVALLRDYLGVPIGPR